MGTKNTKNTLLEKVPEFERKGSESDMIPLKNQPWQQKNVSEDPSRARAPPQA